jgi:hypothetical protein
MAAMEADPVVAEMEARIAPVESALTSNSRTRALYFPPEAVKTSRALSTVVPLRARLVPCCPAASYQSLTRWKRTR